MSTTPSTSRGRIAAWLAEHPAAGAHRSMTMTDQITTSAELDALPVGTVLLDRDGWPLWRHWLSGWCAANGARGVEWAEMERDGAPLSVLYRPDAAPTPRTTPADETARVEWACEVMHDAYEAAAVREGWETQERSRKPWADVPEANKATMRAAVRALLAALAASPGRRRLGGLMTPIDLDAIEARATAATEGPWRVWSGSRVKHVAAVETAWSYDADGGDTELIADCCPIADAKFIAHARTDIPALVTEIRRLRAEVALEAALGVTS